MSASKQKYAPPSYPERKARMIARAREWRIKNIEDPQPVVRRPVSRRRTLVR